MRQAGEASRGRTRDGCWVELYRRLPYAGQIDMFASRLAAGARLLEMGCAAGRMTRPLLERGFRVTVVDNSPEMLHWVPDAAQKVLADIEGLRLDRTFDAVLLASCFMNIADALARAAILDTCAAHLAPGGPLVFERHDVAWLRTVAPGPVAESGGIRISMQSIARNGGRVAMSVLYEDGDERWTHDFETCEMDDAAVASALDAAGFEPPQWLDERRRWGWAPRR